MDFSSLVDPALIADGTLKPYTDDERAAYNNNLRSYGAFYDGSKDYSSDPTKNQDWASVQSNPFKQIENQIYFDFHNPEYAAELGASQGFTPYDAPQDGENYLDYAAKHGVVSVDYDDAKRERLLGIAKDALSSVKNKQAGMNIISNLMYSDLFYNKTYRQTIENKMFENAMAENDMYDPVEVKRAAKEQAGYVLDRFSRGTDHHDLFGGKSFADSIKEQQEKWGASWEQQQAHKKASEQQEAQVTAAKAKAKSEAQAQARKYGRPFDEDTFESTWGDQEALDDLEKQREMRKARSRGRYTG